MKNECIISVKTEAEVQKAAKAILVKALDLQPGTTTFDLNFSIRGEVTKGEDYQQVIAQAACPYTLLAAALNKLNGNTADVIASLVSEVSAMNDKQRLELRTSMKGATQKVMSDLGDSSTKVCSGKTTSKIEKAEILFSANQPLPLPRIESMRPADSQAPEKAHA